MSYVSFFSFTFFHIFKPFFFPSFISLFSSSFLHSFNRADASFELLCCLCLLLIDDYLSSFPSSLIFPSCFSSFTLFTSFILLYFWLPFLLFFSTFRFVFPFPFFYLYLSSFAFTLFDTSYDTSYPWVFPPSLPSYHYQSLSKQLLTKP